jgi:hypothetical protein
MGGIVWFTFTSSAISWAREWEQIAGSATRHTGSREKCCGASRGVFEMLRCMLLYEIHSSVKKNVNVYLPSLMMKVPDHLYV